MRQNCGMSAADSDQTPSGSAPDYGATDEAAELRGLRVRVQRGKAGDVLRGRLGIDGGFLTLKQATRRKSLCALSEVHGLENDGSFLQVHVGESMLTIAFPGNSSKQAAYRQAFADMLGLGLPVGDSAIVRGTMRGKPSGNILLAPLIVFALVVVAWLGSRYGLKQLPEKAMLEAAVAGAKARAKARATLPAEETPAAPIPKKVELPWDPNTSPVLKPRYAWLDKGDASHGHVEWKILVRGFITSRGLRALLGELISQARDVHPRMSEAGVEGPTVWVYAYTSKKRAASNMGQWIGMASQGPRDRTPKLELNRTQLANRARGAQDRHGLSEDKRKALWDKVAHIEFEVAAAARERFPVPKALPTGNEPVAVREARDAQERFASKEIARRYAQAAKELGVKSKVLRSIAREAVARDWPFSERALKAAQRVAEPTAGGPDEAEPPPPSSQ